jgi:hypothetical protein
MAVEKRKQHFDFSSIDKNRINGFWKLCDYNYKDKMGIFSNFLKHLKRMHVHEYRKLFIDQDENSPANVIVDNDYRTTTESSSNNHKQTRVNLAIAKYLIIKCNLPLNLVENCAFREFMKECGCKWNPISSKKLKNDVIGTFTDKMNKLIQDTLNDIKSVTLTVDAWSDRRNRSYIGVTCHFINHKLEAQALLIDFVRFKSPHNSENIYHTTESILDRYNIKEKVYKIVTDNASTMIKAYKFGLSVADEVNDEDNDEIKLNSSTNTTWNDDDRK